MTQIPLVDLQVQHRQVADEVEAGFARVLAQGSFILGADVREFEKRFAEYVGVPHCVGVGSGTDAIEMILRAVDVGLGDEVIVPVNTFIATGLAVARAGATPVFVDCDPVYYLIDVDQAESAISPRTRAILAVHLYGQMARMEDLDAFAQPRGVAVLEDAAQAQGARRGSDAAGAASLASAASFYPGKNLGAYGDAGAVLTRDAEIARRVRELRNYGSEVKYHHPSQGFNSRLDTLQAVVLNAKLRHLSAWNEQRRAAARRYDALLAEVDGVQRPATLSGNEHVWHLYVVRVSQRDQVLERLHEAGVGAAIHYPVPLHRAGAFEGLDYPVGAFPNAEKAAAEILSLPLFPGIEEAQQERVVAALKRSL